MPKYAFMNVMHGQCVIAVMRFRNTKLPEGILFIFIYESIQFSKIFTDQVKQMTQFRETSGIGHEI